MGAMWAVNTGDPRIVIAILDGSIDGNHPAFAGADLQVLGELGKPSKAGPALEHGTQVASVIFGQHESRIRGIAPHCSGMIVPIFQDSQDSDSQHFAHCSQITLARAIDTAVGAGAHVINISAGEFAYSEAAHPLLEDSVLRASQHALIVAAAGNNGCECVNIPGALASVIVVGALRRDGSHLPSSNWGDMYGDHGIVAPGEQIVVADPGGGITVADGTSFATAIVSGVLGLVLSRQLADGYGPDLKQARALLLETALVCDPVVTADCRPFFVGRLDVAGINVALSEAGGTAAMPETPATDRGRAMRLGDEAPDFRLPDHHGRSTTLADHEGHWLVLWFYPAAETPG